MVLEVPPAMIGEVCAIQTETVDIPAGLNHDAARAKTKPGICIFTYLVVCYRQTAGYHANVL